MRSTCHVWFNCMDYLVCLRIQLHLHVGIVQWLLIVTFGPLLLSTLIFGPYLLILSHLVHKYTLVATFVHIYQPNLQQLLVKKCKISLIQGDIKKKLSIQI